MVCHKQETGPLHECEMDQKRADAAAAEAAAKAAAAPVDRASEQYMASIGKRCDLIALLVAACVHIDQSAVAAVYDRRAAAQVPCVRHIHLAHQRLRPHDVRRGGA